MVHNNVLQNFLLVLENAAPKGVTFKEADAFKEFMETYTEDSLLDAKCVELIKKLWADPGFQEVWGQRSTFQVLDSLSYYCQEETLDRMADPDYLPSQMDVLQARVRTSGIVEEKYVIDGVSFVMFDVGGQRNERKKWIHCFEQVRASFPPC